jgi:enamine deaminase RidA (YjgF/YER057c/UK114 family)
MTHTIHDISVASQIGQYSDAIETGPQMRWLMTSGTPGLSEAGELPDDIVGQAELAWQNAVNLLAKAGMTVGDIVKVTQYLTRAEDIKACRSSRALPRRASASVHAARNSAARLAGNPYRGRDYRCQSFMTAGRNLVLQAGKGSVQRRRAFAG